METRQKPDVAAIDGVSVTGAGGFPPSSPGHFHGTSAAAPHVAGVAALLKSAFPTATAGKISNALKNSAVDLGVPGTDTTFGAGRVDALEAYYYIDQNGGLPLVDFDGDSKTDIAVWRPSTSMWYVLQSSNGQVKPTRWGDSTDTAVPGDYDGDGKTDVAVWRSSTSMWYVLQSSNGQVKPTRWGDFTDAVVPGDYDGDGKTDIAVWRSSTGMWYVLQSSDGQVKAARWGDSTDTAVPGDYDGDGKTDIAVWRPSTSMWYVLQSSNGQVKATRWGDSTDEPVRSKY